MILDLRSTSAQLGSFLGGVFLHVFAYRRGEWDLIVPKLCFTYGILQVCIVSWDQLLNDQSHGDLGISVKTVTLLSVYHILGIAMSMVVYRLLFHRLRSFPGPFWARVTNFYATSLSAKKLHLFEEVKALHGQYGDYVRLGEYTQRLQ